MIIEAPSITMGPADLIQYQKDLVRTQKVLPLGRMRTIAIGPCDSFKPPANDPIISGWGPQPQRNARGRMIDLSGQWMPIAQDPKTGMILCTAPLRRADGYVGLPDLVDPTWRAPDFTQEEIENPDCDANCRKQFDIVGVRGKAKKVPHKHIHLRGDKDKPRMIPQRLEDRTNDVLKGTRFMVFQPVLDITYQPEDATKKNFSPSEWRISFRKDGNGDHCAFLVDYNYRTGEGTGECYFLFGVPDFHGDTRRGAY